MSLETSARYPVALGSMPVSINKLTHRNIPGSKQPHPDVPVHVPFRRLTVRVAAMVHEPAQIPLRPRVDYSATCRLNI